MTNDFPQWEGCEPGTLPNPLITQPFVTVTNNPATGLLVFHQQVNNGWYMDTVGVEMMAGGWQEPAYGGGAWQHHRVVT